MGLSCSDSGQPPLAAGQVYGTAVVSTFWGLMALSGVSHMALNRPDLPSLPSREAEEGREGSLPVLLSPGWFSQGFHISSHHPQSTRLGAQHDFNNTSEGIGGRVSSMGFQAPRGSGQTILVPNTRLTKTPSLLDLPFSWASSLPPD